MAFKLTLVNCFLLLIPLLVWNLIFAPKLTQEEFRSDINVPRWILALETVLRVAVFILPIVLPLRAQGAAGKAGVIVYLVGSLVYYASWIPLMYAPASAWSRSAVGVLAPFFTPFILFAGVGLLGHSWVYIAAAALFTAVHTAHGVRAFRLIG